MPLGEHAERYRVTVRQGGADKRVTEVSAAQFDYTTAMRSEDGVSGTYAIEVAQLSELYGPGLARRIELHA